MLSRLLSCVVSLSFRLYCLVAGGEDFGRQFDDGIAAGGGDASLASVETGDAVAGADSVEGNQSDGGSPLAVPWQQSDSKLEEEEVRGVASGGGYSAVTALKGAK